MPELSAMKLDDYMLWCAVLVMFAEPFFRPLFIIQEVRYQFLSFYLGQSITFFGYVLTAYLYSVWAFLVFHNALFAQPRSPELQRNDVLMFGYVIVVLSIIIKMYCYHVWGMAHVMGGQHFNIQPHPKKDNQELPNVYYHPMGTATVMFYLGCAFIRASIAGIVLSVILGLGYFSSSKTERYFLPQLNKSTGSLHQPLHNLRQYSIVFQLMRNLIPIFKRNKSKQE